MKLLTCGKKLINSVPKNKKRTFINNINKNIKKTESIIKNLDINDEYLKNLEKNRNDEAKKNELNGKNESFV